MTIHETTLTATAQVYWEHRVIEAVARVARRLRVETPDGEEGLADVLDFFETYVEAWHFENEEQVLAPLLRAMDTEPARRALQAIVTEHDEAREALHELKAHPTAVALQAYLDRTLDHLRREDGYLYRLLQNSLSASAQRHLGWTLRHGATDRGQAGLVTRQEALARRLCAAHGEPYPVWDEVLGRLEGGQ